MKNENNENMNVSEDADIFEEPAVQSEQTEQTEQPEKGDKTAEELRVPLELAKKIISVLDEKKAREIKLLYVENKTILADYFIICAGTSNTHIKSLSGEVEYKLGLCGVPPHHVEGIDSANWVLMDYSSVIVHIFNRDTRNFYNLEKLWNDAEEIDISEYLTKE